MSNLTVKILQGQPGRRGLVNFDLDLPSKVLAVACCPLAELSALFPSVEAELGMWWNNPNQSLPKPRSISTRFSLYMGTTNTTSFLDF